ncbi:P-loop containing nucleoside triphosphate hydrolase protein [Nadsonia fulvescens var. elongata DSM 6958]|uniref:p-loop containing nucleoside triphosphate hydrolase protein n=1 Tax=Nadsonia fulvescens var. elongata DSM 6958 TaxID=857566 RepID=A0A1E3PKK0_9ASCO|nr:P-loop containing nucleoside triphosphate hydrolase protein [Nadsonia fulvescens var. elongata DSM 6958]
MIVTKNLNYSYPNSTVGIENANINLPSGSRTLLIGANGAGKSTILRVLAGKTLAKAEVISVDGFDPFKDCTPPGITYLGTEWARNPVVRGDMPVADLIDSVGGSYWTDRRDELLDILDVDLAWSMLKASDGQRRRVQMVMGLVKPWSVLLLDEVTVDLDVLVRAKLLAYLLKETELRNASVVYATHIFDGLTGWPTHVAHMAGGRVDSLQPVEEATQELALIDGIAPAQVSLHSLAMHWLIKDRKQARNIEYL